jgi:hypothetical protein
MIRPQAQNAQANLLIRKSALHMELALDQQR